MSRPNNPIHALRARTYSASFMDVTHPDRLDFASNLTANTEVLDSSFDMLEPETFDELVHLAEIAKHTHEEELP